MNKIIKRIVAYFIDVLVVTLVAYLLGYTSILNPQLNKYNKYYDEYIEINESYTEFIKYLEKSYEDKKISSKEYNKIVEKHQKYQEIVDKYYIEEKLTEKNYEKLIKEVDNNYEKEYIKMYYKIEKYSTVYYSIYTVIIILYFTIFNLITKGQTLGKKLMGLKIVSSNDKPLNLIAYLIRTIILYFPIYYIIKIIGVYSLNATNYYTVSTIFYEIQYYLQWIIILMVIIRLDGRGLHDLASHTKVIMIDKQGNEIKDIKEESSYPNQKEIDKLFEQNKNKKEKKKVTIDTYSEDKED